MPIVPYPDWDELELSKRPYPQDKTKDKQYKQKQNALLYELRQEVQDIKDECVHWLPPEKSLGDGSTSNGEAEGISYSRIAVITIEVLVGFILLLSCCAA